MTERRPPAPDNAPVRDPVDIRLASGTAAGWLILVLLLGRSSATVAIVAGFAFSTGAIALLLSRLGYRAAAAVALVGFCVALVLAPYAARLASARASPLAALAASHAAVTAELTVEGDPRLLAAKGVAGSPRVAVDTDVVSVVVGGHRVSVSGTVLVLGPAAPWRDVLPGQRVTLDGTLQPSLDPASTGATMFSNGAPTLVGQPPWWQRAAGQVRASLRQASSGLPAAERGLLPGLVDGDTSSLDPVLVERFRIAGLTHLVAVSGTNCSIMVGALLLVLRRFRVRPWICAAAGGVLLVAFVIVARPSPSVLRAALMAVIALVSLATGRPRQAVPTLAAAVLALLVWNPALASDAGFSMSVLATAALLVIAPGWADALRRWRVPPGLAEALAVAAAAHVVTAPVIAAISGRISLVAIPANALAEPAVPLATVLGFGAAVVSPLWLGGGRVAADCAGWPCRWLVWVADHLGALPGAALPWPAGTGGGLLLLAATAGLILLARRAGLTRFLAAGVLLAAFVQIPVRTLAPGWPPPGWLMVACDIGQGDAIVLSAGGGAAVEIDAGPDPVSVDRCLRDLGVTDVALLAFTHFHLDHVGGIVGVLHGRRVGRVVSGPLLEPVSGVRLVDDALRAHGLTRSVLPAGAALDVGDVHLDVLGPAAAFHGTRSDPNNSSLVLRATIHGTRILLPGDAEIEAQQALLAAGVDLRADVLKVPHHGSAYSDPAFLAAVHARVGVISVGLNNDYGHPSPVLLAEMAHLGVPVRRTDHDGDVAVVGSGARLSTVARGTAASTAALGPALTGQGVSASAVDSSRLTGPGISSTPTTDLSGAPTHPQQAGSEPSARMGAGPVLSVPIGCAIRFRRSSRWSQTMNCSSIAQSARSPPKGADATAWGRSDDVPAKRWRCRTPRSRQHRFDSVSRRRRSPSGPS